MNNECVDRSQPRGDECKAVANPYPRMEIGLDVSDGKLYQPSNGTEGQCFQEGWCYHCKRDRAFQESGGVELGCDIIARSMAFNPSHPKYPKEWIFQNGSPVCTAFDDVALQITNDERAAQVPLL